MNIPRPEYPRPQFVRPDWLCLNGEWQFEIDAGDSGRERGLLERELSDRITVPFCPESPLSGVHHTDFMNAVWYRRTVTIPEAWASRRVLLHFQAVDYDATVWVNGVEVGRHRGGFTPFTCDLAGVASPGEEAVIVVRARDDHRPPQPRGKQSQRYANYGCLYTRTTGIWQTVWLEPVPDIALDRPRLTPDVANGLIRLEQPISSNRPGLQLRATLCDADGPVCTATCPTDADLTPCLNLCIPEERRRLWGPGDPQSYPYRGQPFFVSEFGGIWWNPDARPGEDSWGYGERPRTLEEFYCRFEGLCNTLLDNLHMFGYCYTQLTDIYQEQNGIYTFDRRVKFDLERLRRIQGRPAAIERGC